MGLQTNTEGGKLIRQAINKFAATTGVPIKIAAYEHQIVRDRTFDALANIETAAGTKTYAIEAKRHLTTAKLGLAAQQLKVAPYKGMLITDYANPKMADRLKEMDLAFIDLAGNAYLNEPPIFVYIKGNRPADTDALGPTLKPTRAFRTAGLKILFALLTRPELVQETYRDIAETADVALGTVAGIFNNLREHGYLYEGTQGERRLIRKRQLIEQWVTAYPDKLRPKLRLGRYRAPKIRWWKDVDIEPYNAQWGAEIAGAKLTKYLIPEKTVIYAHVLPTKLLAKYQLKVDPEGDVEILRRFWKHDLFDGIANWDVPFDVVPPLLVYADLIATFDERNVETAKIVYEKFLIGHID